MGRSCWIVMLIVAALVTNCRDKDTGRAVSPADGTALDFSLQLVNGELFYGSDFFGSVVLINFWDTWCGPCQAEQPELNRLFADYHDDGLEVIGIALARNGVPAVATYLEENDVPYTSGIIGPDITAVFGSPAVIPFTYIINRSGEIVESFSGSCDYDEFVSDIEPFLSD